MVAEYTTKKQRLAQRVWHNIAKSKLQNQFTADVSYVAREVASLFNERVREKAPSSLTSSFVRLQALI